jgi:hypothetical protein
MRKRKYLIGATLGVLGALVVSGTAMAGQPTTQKLTVSFSPKKQDKKKFGGVSVRLITDTAYDNFAASPSSSEALFTFPKDLKLGINGNLPPCTQTTLQSSASTAAVQAACGGSIVGQGSALVNAGQAPFTAPNPVLVVSGGRNVLYVWVSIQGGTTVVLNGQITSRTLLVTGLPNVPGVDLTLFDVTLNKKKTSKSTFYAMARCSGKKKWTTSENVKFHNGQQLSASSTQKCAQKKSK